MDAYAAAKKSLFTKERCAFAVLNADDAFSRGLAGEIGHVTYGLETPSDAFAVVESDTLRGCKAVLNLQDELCEVMIPLTGRHNLSNALAAACAAKRLGARFGIVDLSLAPTPARGDSVAHILEELGLEVVGGHGTTAALAMLNDAVKKGGVMASSRVGGLSGAFIPVSEDIGMIESATAGRISLDKLEAMTCVCSVGLDMIAIPGDTPASTISAIIADEAAIGMVNNKTTAVRVIPAPGKNVGDEVSFGGLLGRAPVMPVHTGDASKFIRRGGLIPAPIHSFKN